MNQFTYEEIREWVIDNVYYWHPRGLGRCACERWSREQIMTYFEDHYGEDFEMIEG